MKAERKGSTIPEQRPRRAKEEASTLVVGRFDRYLEAAQRIPKRDVRRFRGHWRLIGYNLSRGLKAVLAQEERIRRELPSVNLEELREISEIWMAMRAQALDAQNRKSANKNVAPLLAEARKWRMIFLSTAKSFVVMGIWPEHIVESIRKGRGAIDIAMDCLALAEYFEKREEEIRGKTPITRKEIQRAHAVGEKLIRIIRPTRAEPRKDEPWRKAAEMRDRLWTLLCQRHEVLWRVGAYLFGHAVTEHVPYLHTRHIKRKKPAAET